jgi:hypothetical protein
MDEWPPPISAFGLCPLSDRGNARAVGILEGHPDLCSDTLLNLPEKDLKYQRYSMERWASGIDGPQNRCHRFDGTDFFVFKDVGKQHRFYGFLYHPLPKTKERFLLCVLTTYGQKKEDNSDPVYLSRVSEWMSAPATKAAIKLYYPDEPEKD